MQAICSEIEPRSKKATFLLSQTQKCALLQSLAHIAPEAAATFALLWAQPARPEMRAPDRYRQTGRHNRTFGGRALSLILRLGPASPLPLSTH